MADYILAEDGSYLLREDGSRFLREIQIIVPLPVPVIHIPALGFTRTIIPSLLIEATNATVYDPGYSFNQAGQSFNSPGAVFGGVFRSGQDAVPGVSLATLPVPGAQAAQTEAVLIDQGYTFNQAGLSFNSPGVTFGGLSFRGRNIIPVFARGETEPVHIISFGDIYTRPVSPGGSFQSLGPGFFLYITYQ